MATVTVSRPDVSLAEVADTLRLSLGGRYQVRTESRMGGDERLTVARGPARVLRATVTISRQGEQTALHVHSGGLTLPLQLLHRTWIVPEVLGALRSAPALR